MKRFKHFITELHGKGALPGILKHHETEQSKHLAAARHQKGSAQKHAPTKHDHMARHHTNQVVRAKKLGDKGFSHKRDGYATQSHRWAAKEAKRKADQYE